MATNMTLDFTNDVEFITLHDDTVMSKEAFNEQFTASDVLELCLLFQELSGGDSDDILDLWEKQIENLPNNYKLQ